MKMSFGATLLCSSAIFLALASQAFAQARAFDVPAEDAIRAVPEFARQAGIQILVPADRLKGVQTPAVKGEMDVHTALSKLLIGTGFAIASDDGQTIALTVPSKNVQAASNDGAGSTDSTALNVETVVVTGTHLHGVSPASPVITLDRTAIDVSGYSEVGDVIRSLPQNFSGGNNPQVQTAAAPGQNSSSSGGTAPNLRGLGPQSTLTLVDGHRLGQDTIYGGVDISEIPLDAIDHVDVVTDGASAIYGSDAVGGVVNFVLRKNFDGAQTTAAFGGATNGGGSETRLSQLLGTSWSSGGVYANYEYDHQTPVYSSQRAFTSAVISPYTLLPGSNRNSLFLSGHQDIWDGISAFVEGTYTSRDAGFASAFATNAAQQNVPVEEYQLSGGFNAALPGNWNASLTGSAAKQGSTVRTQTTFSNGATPTNVNAYYSGSTQSVEATADGPLLSLPSGEVRGAIGGGYRAESYGFNSTKGSRSITYVYGEASIPLVAPSETIGLEKLEIDLSGRFEHYSDFGDAAVPKAGIVYEPVHEAVVRVSYGQSYRAPGLYQLTSPFEAVLFSISNPLSMTGSSPVIVTEGGNNSLKPETASTWSASVEYNPDWIDGLRWTNSYYNVLYKNRIGQIPSIFTALTDPSNAAFVSLAPSAAAQQQVINHSLASSGIFPNATAGVYNPSAVAAIVSFNPINVTRQSIQGLDSTLDYKFSLGSSALDLFSNAAYQDIDQQTTPTGVQQQLAGTTFSPPRYRVRSGLSWSQGDFSATGTLNYLSGSHNIFQAGNPQVGSWTTFDTQISFKPSEDSGILKGAQVALSVQNLFDTNPPYVLYDQFRTGFHYDNLNANPLGRFISLRLIKAW